MSTVEIDVLAYAKSLEDAGFNRLQAEAIARGNSTMLAQRFDALVTQASFDLTKEQFEREFEQVNRRFGEVDRRLDRVDQRLDSIEARLGGLDTMKSQVTVLTWMMGLVILVLVVPQLQAWFSPV